MINIQNSIQTKLTASFVILIFSISVGVFVFTFGGAKNALKELTRSELREIITLAQSQISREDVKKILNLREGDEGSPNHLELVSLFNHMRANSEDVTNYYVMKKDGQTISFLLDDVYPNPTDTAAINEIYYEPDQVLVDKWGEVSVSEEFYSDKWGTFLSAYAPLVDDSGKVAAILGADMRADKVITRQNFIGNTVYIIIGLSVFLAGIIILLFSKTIIRDLKKLSEEAQRISAGDMSLVIDIQRKDEIGELAVTFNQMARSIRESHESLEGKIKERTAELEKAKTGLEEKVNQRTSELQNKLEEVKRMNELMINRELRMIELKKMVEELGGKV